MADEMRNYWWLNANPAIWSFSDFAPGEENNYSQFNENGSPRKNPKFFPMVRPGDLVLGYVDSPQKKLVCLCQITRPLENGEFHFKKLQDFPTPVPASAWTSDSVLAFFHFKGSLFKLSPEQWDSFIELVKERNPGMKIQEAPVAHDLEARIDAFLASFKPTKEIFANREKAEAERKAFIERFPLESLSSLTPEQYCIGRGDKNNFCWWIERGTHEFGRYFPGTSRSYGMYYKQDSKTLVSSKILQKSMPTASDAELLRKSILEPLHRFVASHGKSDGSHVIGNGFSLKILELYLPDEFIRINSVLWLARIVTALELPIGNAPAISAFLDSQTGRYPVADNLAVKKFYEQKKKQFPKIDFDQADFIRILKDVLKLGRSTVDNPSSEPTEPTPKASHSLNTILYGPPGTGKTHNNVNYVLEIIDGVPVPVEQTAEEYAAAKKRFDELKAQGRVGFVTFHQSYGYEDFIEGIRPVLGENAGDAVAYELHDGVFKAFCKRAHGPSAKSMSDFGLNANPVIWKVSLEGTGDNETRRDCLKNGRIRIGWDDYGPVLDPESLQEAKEGRVILGAFIDGMSVGDIVLSCWSASEIDAIGVVTGEYEWHDEFEHYKRGRTVRWLVKDIRENIVELNGGKKLTLATVYRLNRMQLADVLALVAKYQGNSAVNLLDTAPLPYVFIIDEINRGNISKIFGELITLVEAGKRLGAEEETRAVLPYSGEEFGVPPNVYILGTMNTADRSIALLDTALRRRFDFVEMMPRPELLRGIKVVDGKGKDTGLDLEKMLAAMNGRIEFLLDREHTIGHAYFLGGGAEGGAVSAAEVADIFQFRIVPLLQEYFFEDYAKIRLVLGDASFKRKVPGFQFVTEEKGLAKVLFPGVPEDFGGPVNGDRAVYRINGQAFDRVEAYRGIYGPVAGGGGGVADGSEEGE